VASRWRAIWDWFQEKSPAGIVNDWDISAVRSDGEWRRKYFHLALRRGRRVAKVDFDCCSDSVGQSRVCLLTENVRQDHTYLIAEKSPLRHSSSSAVPPG